MTLPRLQTASSSKPIISDLGERAVEAVREGISKAASDFVNIDSSDYPPATANGTMPDTSERHAHQLPSPPASPPSIRSKRIPMPAGFPGYSAAAMNTPTPGASTRLPPQLPAFAAAASSRVPPQTPQAVPAGRTSSVAQSSAYEDNASQFRFRGAFASQPGTPGVPSGLGMAEDQQRRRGVLNSRAA